MTATRAIKSLMAIFSVVTATEFIRYAIAAGAAWLFFCVIIRRRWLHRKIVKGSPRFREVWRELSLSVLTCVVYGVVTLAMIVPITRHWTRMYFNIHAYNWWWFVASLILTVLLHDAYFYWTHRLMHMRRLFPIMHRAHHRSTNPTSWAAYSFHPIEAFVQAGIVPLAIFLYPLHPLGIFIFMTWQITFNVLGHCGFEVLPGWLLDWWPAKLLNTPTNHVMHHQHFNCNFGIYLNLWDRLMKTNHKDYEARFREITSRKPAAV